MCLLSCVFDYSWTESGSGSEEEEEESSSEGSEEEGEEEEEEEETGSNSEEVSEQSAGEDHKAGPTGGWDFFFFPHPVLFYLNIFLFS